jgi:hypothetical protein
LGRQATLIAIVSSGERILGERSESQLNLRDVALFAFIGEFNASGSDVPEATVVASPSIVVLTVTVDRG